MTIIKCNNLRILLSVSILTFLHQYGSSQTISPRISGRFLFTSRQVPDSILITTDEQEGNQYGNLKIIYAKINTDNRFDVILPPIKKLTLFNIGNNSFYVSPSDSVNFNYYEKKRSYPTNFKDDSIFVTGSGAEKYNLTEKLSLNLAQDLFESKERKDIAMKFDSISDPNRFADLLLKYDSLIYKWQQKSDRILNANFGSDVKLNELIGFQFSRLDSEWWWWIYHLYKTKKSYRTQITKHFILQNSKFFSLPTKLSQESPKFISQYLAKIKLKNIIELGRDSIDLTSYYNLIKSEKISDVRDRLLVELFFGTFSMEDVTYTPSSYKAVLTEALKLVENPQYKSLMVEKEVLIKGSAIKHGSFVDKNDKEFDISSLRGKIVLLDIWFTGCQGCADFHKRFEDSIQPLYKQKNDFIYLSVNADKRKAQWLSSLDSGKYTSKDYLNVYTGGLGFEHPFFEYYKIYGGPFMIVIDRDGLMNGKLFGPETSNQKVIDLINSAYKASK